VPGSQSSSALDSEQHRYEREQDRHETWRSTAGAKTRTGPSSAPPRLRSSRGSLSRGASCTRARTTAPRQCTGARLHLELRYRAGAHSRKRRLQRWA
jgi:hypothetical protein